jgi:hypothetical protein
MGSKLGTRHGGLVAAAAKATATQTARLTHLVLPTSPIRHFSALWPAYATRPRLMASIVNQCAIISGAKPWEAQHVYRTVR